METESEREMIKLVGDLVNLEDELQDAQDEIELLRAKRRRTRTLGEQERLELLPNTVTSLEELEMVADNPPRISAIRWRIPASASGYPPAGADSGADAPFHLKYWRVSGYPLGYPVPRGHT
ncbi:hypothetical protein PGT21_019919 [Puccinia graminis f. sp. tritici]|uniref:Uncharacterized protein n=1 Tax=Puccinia graminis f. sp. tritici TaxID=56615 RepID=A0A5B0P4T4_PUCGR|nr:hypothetical protein PGT21_019919 [Puccinia graminis f. sp. tritici]